MNPKPNTMSRKWTPLGLARIFTNIIIGLILIQFLTGMGLNLFATFSDASSSTLSAMLGIMMVSPLSAAHLMVGILVPLIGAVILAIFVDSRESRLAMIAEIGLVCVGVAGLSGLGFVYSGFQNQMYSYLMAVGFVFAFISYFFIQYHLIASRATTGSKLQETR